MANRYIAIVEKFLKTHCTWNFHGFVSKCRVIDAGEGHVKVEFDVGKEHTNPLGTLHGGCTATLIDTLTTSSLFTTAHGSTGVSIDLSVSYLLPAQVGETVILDARVVKMGKNLAFTRADVFRKRDMALIAFGKQSMSLISKEKFNELIENMNKKL